MIKVVDFNSIYQIWRLHLWPERKSPIEQTSAMSYLGGYDLKNMDNAPTFFAYFINNNIVGVNSGHMCFDRTYRSRGLFVFPEFRGNGIGQLLLEETIKQGHKENAHTVWSYPKISSWNTYLNAGFSLASDWENSELGKNAYCKVNI